MYRIITEEEHEYNVDLEQLRKKNKQLRETIDKAIEYIEEHLTDKGRFLMLNEWQVPDLLGILKEVE